MQPAIVLRGYGGDEILVHRQLNPGLEVIASKDRGEGIAKASSRGATVAVLDDAFQHRRAGRDADVVLVSADSWTGRTQLLPAGPWREPLSSIRRASLAVITRKAVGEDRVARVAEAISRVAPDLRQATLRLRMSDLTRVGGGDSLHPESLAGKRVLAVSAIGDPAAFIRQLSLLGASVTPFSYPDHHPFSRADSVKILSESSGHDAIVCTLKDVVKLGPLWPAKGPALWYVSQIVDVESGHGAIDDLIAGIKLLASSQPS
jgi:tetraacyldisaccharide 4'-kinase